MAEFDTSNIIQKLQEICNKTNSSNSVLENQYSNIRYYHNRGISYVFKDMENLWKESNENAVKFCFLLRLVTRVIQLPNGTKTKDIQYGRGLRDESFKRLLWLAEFQPNIFYSKLGFLPLIGSWKDIWTLMVMAEENAISVNKNIFFELLRIGLNDKSQNKLVRKYLPRIKTKSNIHSNKSQVLTNLAKEFCKYLGITFREYNKIKSNFSQSEDKIKNETDYTKALKFYSYKRLEKIFFNQEIIKLFATL